MASKVLFFILAVLNVNIICTAAFSSNIHEIMTPEEIFETFGIDDGSVPDYRVIPMTLPGTRRRRQADDGIYLKVEINCIEINLILKPTDRYLATRYIPVWSAVTDPKAYNEIRYDPLPNVMEDIGAFKMYHDVDNKAAIVVYVDSDHETIIEGIVTSDYVIKSLPKRLTSVKVGDNHFVKSPIHHKRSIEPNVDEVTSYLVLFKSSPLAEVVDRNVYRNISKRRSRSWESKRTVPKALYPEILVVLDHNAIRNHTIIQALRSVLALWNAVDMVYSKLNNPKVYLNIAGIIISADDAATPYIARDTSIKIKTDSEYILEGLGQYFAKELDRFPLRQYDLIFAMTSIHLCSEGTDPCEILLGFTSLTTACTLEREAKLWKKINGVGVVHYNRMFGGVHAAVHESAHLLGVHHDMDEEFSVMCSNRAGFAMASDTEFRHQSLKWSPCSQMYFRRFFSSWKSKCLDNTPRWRQPVKEVLPGRWLNLDGQCQNSGFEKSCLISEIPICMIHGCKAKQSDVCEIRENLALPGTECGEKKYCKSGVGCIRE